MEGDLVTWIHDNCISCHVNRCRIKEAEELINRINQERKGLFSEIEEKKFDRGREISRLQFLINEERKFKYTLVFQGRIVDVLEKAMQNPSFADKAYQENAIKSLLVDEDTNFRKLHFQMLHGALNLAEEKQLLRETNPSQRRGCIDLKQDLTKFVSQLFHNRHFNKSDDLWPQGMLWLIDKLECTRKKAIANVALMGMIWDILGPKKAIKDKIKTIRKGSNEIKKGILSLKAEMKHVERRVKAIEFEIDSLWRRVEAANRRKIDTQKCIEELRKYNETV